MDTLSVAVWVSFIGVDIKHDDELDMLDISNPQLSGTIEGKVHQEGLDYITNLFFNSPRNMVMNVDSKAMNKIRKETKSGDVIVITQAGYESKWKMIRRDWKHNRVHLREILDN